MLVRKSKTYSLGAGLLLLLMVKAEAASASRAHPALLTPLQGKAACVNCRGDMFDVATSGAINASAINLRKKLTVSYWENPLTYFSAQAWSTVNFFTYADPNFLQLFMGPFRADFFYFNRIYPGRHLILRVAPLRRLAALCVNLRWRHKSRQNVRRRKAHGHVYWTTRG